MIPWLSSVVLLLAGNPLSVILQFDGSLRHPSDPGVPTSSLGRMAACAACILVDGKVVQVGGKGLAVPVSSTMTSGEVEYEGLLFGLAGLLACSNLVISSDAQEANPGPSSEVLITVQGDCKNVMEQMSGMAKPRKLEGYHQRTVAFAQDTLPPHFRLDFQHVPRADNLLCDRVSARILLEQQETAYRSVCQELENLWKQTCKQREGDEKSSHPGRQALSQLFFSPGMSLIPLSQRPELYHGMARIAVSMNDFTMLLTIGKTFQDDLDSVRSCALKTPPPTTGGIGASTVAAFARQEISELLLLEAVMYQILALEALYRTKEAAMIRRKKRYMLSWFSAEARQIQERLLAAPHRIDESALLRLVSLNQSGNALHRAEEWPALALRWHERALQSQAWEETQVFWSNESQPAKDPI